MKIVSALCVIAMFVAILIIPAQLAKEADGLEKKVSLLSKQVQVLERQNQVLREANVGLAKEVMRLWKERQWNAAGI